MYYIIIYHTPSILGTKAMAGVNKPNLPISSVVGSRFTVTSLLSSIQKDFKHNTYIHGIYLYHRYTLASNNGLYAINAHINS